MEGIFWGRNPRFFLFLSTEAAAVLLLLSPGFELLSPRSVGWKHVPLPGLSSTRGARESPPQVLGAGGRQVLELPKSWGCIWGALAPAQGEGCVLCAWEPFLHRTCFSQSKAGAGFKSFGVFSCVFFNFIFIF